MYEAHFGLNQKPFSITPDAEFLYFSDKHRAALLMLEYGVFEQSGITVITGDVGCGKTTLVRHLLGTIPYDQMSVGLVSNVHPTLGTLLQWVAIALDLHVEDEASNMQTFRKLTDYLIEEYAQGRKVVLIFDEAQNMGESALEQLRMLMNINADKHELLQVVLVGQPELQDLLRKPDMEQLAQRVTVEYHLEPLDMKETGDYLKQRLVAAGSETGRLFDTVAVEVLYKFSGGIPRLINSLADHALVLAYGAGDPSVSGEIALEAVRQKRIGGVHRQVNSPRTSADANK